MIVKFSGGGDTKISWAAVNASSAGYKIAQQYIVLSATMTTMINWRMTIFTDNLAAATGFHLAI